VTDRSRSYSTEGIVLRRRNIGEADSIFTLFSRDEGKFDAVARGVRKAKSRMRGHLEPLTRVQVHVARGRNLDVFTQAETIEAHRALKADLDRMNLALYCAELADRFTIDRVEQRPIYELLVDVFRALDGGASAQAARYFELHLLAITGYEAQLDACAICRQKLPEEDTLISGAAGGLVCRSCRPAAALGRIVSVRAVKVLRFGRTASIEQFGNLRVDPDLGHELQAALGDLVRQVLDRELNTTRYMDALERADRFPALSANHVQSDPSNLAPPEL
jgi:DNA repair protein RecO (recombination protein O)